MKISIRKMLVALSAMVVSGASLAACRLADDLMSQYGISAVGMRKNVRAAQDPAPKSYPKGWGWYSLSLPLGDDHVSDGFWYEVWIDSRKGLAWIYESGGLMPQRHWYGPLAINLRKYDLRSCDLVKIN